MSECCENCMYSVYLSVPDELPPKTLWQRVWGRPDEEWRYGMAVIKAKYKMICCRYPDEREKYKFDWCGEWRAEQDTGEREPAPFLRAVGA